MIDNGGDEFHWRETYFILFDSRNRPTLTQVEGALGELNHHYELSRLTADEDGHFESVTISSKEDNAALEISFESGNAVIEQGTELAKQLKDEAGPDQLAELLRADARFDVMHFEHMQADADTDADELDDMLDPSCLLSVVEVLVGLTQGVPIDPASGAILP